MTDYLLTHINEDFIEKILSHRKENLGTGSMPTPSGRVDRKSSITDRKSVV